MALEQGSGSYDRWECDMGGGAVRGLAGDGHSKIGSWWEAGWAPERFVWRNERWGSTKNFMTLCKAM